MIISYLYKILLNFIKLKLHVNFICRNEIIVGCIFHLNNNNNNNFYKNI